MKRATVVISGLLILLLSPLVQAQQYPAKPIQVILPFLPGGAADALMRPLAPKLAELTGQQWVLDNRAGANGNIAAEVTANAAPDGCTLFLPTARWSPIRRSTASCRLTSSATLHRLRWRQ